MWPYKDYLIHSSKFDNKGNFESRLENNLNQPTIYSVIFLLEVMVKIHSQYDTNNLKHFNSLLLEIVKEVQDKGSEVALNIIHFRSERLVIPNISKMSSSKEEYKFKFVGLKPSSTSLEYKIPSNYSFVNLNCAFTHLLLSISQILSDELNDVLIRCLVEFTVNEKFMSRSYEYNNYNIMIKQMVNILYPNTKKE